MNKMVSQLLRGNDILSVQATLLRFDRGVDDHLSLVFEDNFETYEGVHDPAINEPIGALKIGEQYELSGWPASSRALGTEPFCFDTIDPAPHATVGALAQSKISNSVIDVIQSISEMLGMFAYEPVIQFVDTAITDPRVLNGFLSAGASAQYHHSEKGGLCRHSLECAQLVSFIPREFFTSDLGHEVAMAAALLHDVGKVEAYGRGFRAVDLPHEDRAATLLSGPLDALTHSNRSAGELMKLLLNNSAKRSRQICSPELIAVTFADRVSAARDRAQRSFAKAPRHHSVVRFDTPFGPKRAYRAVA